MESEPPLLLISDLHEKEKQVIYSVRELRFRTLGVHLLLGKEIQGSGYGWLVLVSKKTPSGRIECCLFNPVSMDIIKLPDLKMCGAKRCVLSKQPTEPDCHILFNSCNNVEQNFCRIGDHEFVQRITHKQDGFRRKLKAIGSFQCKIYGLVMNPPDSHELVTIHFVDKTLKLRPVLGSRPWRIPQLSPPWIPGENFNIMWLVESPQGRGGAELLLVQKTYSIMNLNHGVEFRVFRIDMKKMEFVELESIGERIIFIGHHGSVFCRSSSVGLKSNSVYYTDPYLRNLYVFDLEDRSTTSMLPSSVARRDSVTSWVEYSSCHKLFSN